MAKKARQPLEHDIVMSPPELWALEFKRVEDSDEKLEEKTPISFGLGFSRPALDQLGVEFFVEINNTPAVKISVTYRAEFKLEPQELQDVDYEAAFRQIGATVAPSAIYPFIREVVASAAARAGLPPIILPVINFRNFFKPTDMNIPAFTEPEEDGSEAVDELSAIA